MKDNKTTININNYFFIYQNPENRNQFDHINKNNNSKNNNSKSSNKNSKKEEKNGSFDSNSFINTSLEFINKSMTTNSYSIFSPNNSFSINENYSIPDVILRPNQNIKKNNKNNKKENQKINQSQISNIFSNKVKNNYQSNLKIKKNEDLKINIPYSNLNNNVNKSQSYIYDTVHKAKIKAICVLNKDNKIESLLDSNIKIYKYGEKIPNPLIINLIIENNGEKNWPENCEFIVLKTDFYNDDSKNNECKKIKGIIKIKEKIKFYKEFCYLDKLKSGEYIYNLGIQYISNNQKIVFGNDDLIFKIIIE